MKDKYCIGCQHLCYEEKQMGYGTAQTGSWTIEEASMCCAKGHWKSYFNQGQLGFDFEKAMETAATCPDFSERMPPPEDSYGN